MAAWSGCLRRGRGAAGNRLLVPLALCAVLGLLSAGCARGFIYTHTVEPLDIDFDQTPVGTAHGVGDVKHFRYRVSILWDSNAIGDIARRVGLSRLYYADLERLSVIGIWHQYHVHVYGE